MLALVLGGPGAVESLMDVVGRSRANTVRFSPLAVHPTPFLRILINTLLLRRLGLGQLADQIDKAWRALYPRVTGDDIPRDMLAAFKHAAELVIDTMIFQPHAQLAGKSVAKIIDFGPAQMQMIAQAGRIWPRGRILSRFRRVSWLEPRATRSSIGWHRRKKSPKTFTAR